MKFIAGKLEINVKANRSYFILYINKLTNLGRTNLIYKPMSVVRRLVDIKKS